MGRAPSAAPWRRLLLSRSQHWCNVLTCRCVVAAAGGEVLRDLQAPGREEEQRFEAASVAQAARARGDGSSGVLDALEAAEAAQEAADGRRGELPSGCRRRIPHPHTMQSVMSGLRCHWQHAVNHVQPQAVLPAQGSASAIEAADLPSLNRKQMASIRPNYSIRICAARVPSIRILNICLSDRTAAADDASPSAKRQRLTGESPRAAGRGAEQADMGTRQRVTAKLAEVSLLWRPSCADDQYAISCGMCAEPPHWPLP